MTMTSASLANALTVISLASQPGGVTSSHLMEVLHTRTGKRISRRQACNMLHNLESTGFLRSERGQNPLRGGNPGRVYFAVDKLIRKR